MKPTRVLLCAAGLALLQACASTSDLPSETRYTGQVFSSGAMLPVTTVFWKNAKGGTVGRYTFEEPDNRTVSGTLGPCEHRDGGTVRCEWQDPYGRGYFYARFGDDLRTFQGRWGSGDLNHSLTVDGIWNGTR